MDKALNASPRAYRAICFDLDGTLLPMDLDKFMESYFHTLGAYLLPFGLDSQSFMAGMKAGIKAMAANDGSRLNADAYWEGFFTFVDRDAADWETILDNYYENEFGALGANVAVDPAAARAINTLVDKGYTLALTTMPMFPRRAVEWRLTWAGVNPAHFSRITVFDNSTSVKPQLAYYAENLAALGVSGESVLMVGNNTKEDSAFQGLGADVYLVTDYLLDPIGFNIESVRHGSLFHFADWVTTLPNCADPAVCVEGGRVLASAREQFLQENRIEGITDIFSGEFVINGVEE